MNKDGEDFLKGDDSLDELLMERFALAEERIAEICTEKEIKEPFGEFFQKTAEFLGKTGKILKREQEELSLEELKAENTALYEELFPENYKTSYGNPAYAAEKLGEYGQSFCFLYAEL